MTESESQKILIYIPYDKIIDTDIKQNLDYDYQSRAIFYKTINYTTDKYLRYLKVNLLAKVEIPLSLESSNGSTLE